MTRFELATPRPPDVCATGLRYIPLQVANVKAKIKNSKNAYHLFNSVFTKLYSGVSMMLPCLTSYQGDKFSSTGFFNT